MARIVYEGLDGCWKGALIWGTVGLLCRIARPVPWELMALAVLCAALAGVLCAWWLWTSRTRWIGATGWVTLLAFALLAHSLSGEADRGAMGALGFLSLGAIFTACQNLVFGLAGGEVVRRMNHRHRDLPALLEPPPKKAGLPDIRDDGDTRERFLSALPEPLRTDYRAALAEAVFARTFRSLETLPPTRSALGGAPLLPAACPWPARNGRPLDFLAQINLAEVPPTSAQRPAAGLLAFFYDVENQPWGGDPEDLGSAAVIFIPDPATAATTPKPGANDHPPLRQPLGFQTAPVFDGGEELEERFYSYFRSLPPDARAELSELHDALLESEPCGHRVLSPPGPVQGAMDDELATAARAFKLPPDTRWTMLLQLESDRNLDWCWGDAGCLYFWLPTDDLAAARFDRCWVVLQCS